MSEIPKHKPMPYSLEVCEECTVLRQQLAQVTQERDEAIGSFNDAIGREIHLIQQLAEMTHQRDAMDKLGGFQELRRQLAEVTKERDLALATASCGATTVQVFETPHADAQAQVAALRAVLEAIVDNRERIGMRDAAWALATQALLSKEQP